MKRKVYVESRGNIRIEGNSAKEAKANLREAIDKALEGSYDPVVISCRNMVGVVYRDLDGWHTTTPFVVGEKPSRCWCSASDSKEQAVSREKISMAQILCGAMDDDSEVEGVLQELEMNEYEKRDLRSYVAFQRQMRRAVEKGASVDVAHALACGYATKEQRQQYGFC
jgi:hypothetical protein